ncbi:HTH_Tnp_Tc3_2 domain-containing protein [Trichonephila clavipes]|nr:HTH_Tnp_Tc3_2 domain-containing protein [Trichonephila clavipes]
MTWQCKSRLRKLANPETVRNVLKTLVYHGRVPQRKPYISKGNRQARLAFAKIYVGQPSEYWVNIIVDESKYNNSRSDVKQKVWWNRMQQCMSKIYGLLSDMEGVTKLSGAAW